MEYLELDDLTIELQPLNYFQSDYRQEDYSYFYDHSKHTEDGATIIEEYSISVFTEGTAQLTINGIAHLFRPGSVCCYKPGQTNIQNHDYSYACYGVHLKIYKKDTGESLDESDRYCCFADRIPDYSEPANFTQLLEALISYERCKTDTEQNRLRKRLYHTKVIWELYSLYKNDRDPNVIMHPAAKKAIAYFKQNLDISIPMSKVAREAGVSEKYFQKIFKESTGKTPNQYLLQMRLDLAVKKLITTKMSIADIAFESGFGSHSYFSKMFQKHYHCTPAEFRIWKLKS